MPRRKVLIFLCITLSGCVAFGPMDGRFYAVGSTPPGSSCLLDVAAEGSGESRGGRAVSGDFREGFIIGPSRKGHRITLTCDGSVVASRKFRYGRDVHIGGELAVSGDVP